ncbi:polyprenol phosphomannose-dependent alpha 1,6 mannosyltransferase MptB [Actinokineospora sp. UTMC 2448]|uniref:polyprenol phosphomannose-dependent alpha 1,6 mannosyltransferase MptB n=1 Tax=Actinokineospora sp. UTMC 2448 TaxID=2268449 RepID=UPI00216443FB|nr:polyprenol phosphomannose-dependent alpha 1,6 mannosyltransferase MptB [Actinokineospora sp. UTMC 2448]UVS79395.1 carotene biosynthesis associated membrane protein [Actinokineospora sp. UTMC 2448]
MVADNAEPAAATAPASPRRPLPVRTIALGAAGSVLVLLGSFGAAGILARDPVLGHGPLSWIRYGHGQMLATMVLYVGFLMLVWAWVRLGRHVLADRVASRPVLIAAAAWTAPLLIAPPVFTRDVFSYLAQGALPLHGMDPYEVGPIMLGVPELVQNVHPFWVSTPAPYGPLFILLAKGVAAVAGSNVIVGVILTRLVLLIGLGLLLWALPGLVRHLGGKLSVALWLAVAGPMTVVHLVGGPHNDLLMVGFLAAGALCVLDRRHVLGVVLVTLGAAVKATSLIALPFLVWVWAGHLDSTPLRNFVRAFCAAVTTFAVTFVGVTFLSLGAFDLGWLNSVNAPTMIVNWLSLPTAIGEVIHSLVSLFVEANKSWFVNIVRVLGALVFLYIAVKQWWRAREGGPDAVRRMALVFIAIAVLSPTMLPWYLTWGFAIAAALAWQQRQLALVVAGAVFLVLTYSPAGEDLLYNWPFIACAVAVSVLAGISLLRPDPLRLFRDHDELAHI